MKRIITAAALAAALLAGAPRAAAVCPYTVGPLGRYIAPAVVQGMTATDDGNAVEVWCTDALDGDDWFFTVDNETDLRIFDRVQLVVDAAGTPDDFSDDRVIDALYCHDCGGPCLPLFSRHTSGAVILPGCRPGRAAGIHRGPFFPAWPSKCILAHFRPLERRRLLFFPRPLSVVSNLFVRILLNSDYSLFFSFHLWAFCSPLFISESL